MGPTPAPHLNDAFFDGLSRSMLDVCYADSPLTGEANWGHAIVIPFIGLYYLYINRDKLKAAPVRTAWSGAGIMVGGILLFAYGIFPGQNDFVKDFGMVVTLFGVVTLLCGWAVMKTAWFPIAFLVCGLPWPGLRGSPPTWVASSAPRSSSSGNVQPCPVREITVARRAAGSTPRESSRSPTETPLQTCSLTLGWRAKA